ncbi:hypothetical protein [Flavisolibacter tropicus]|uniref:Uncharacterized protein n=1 Tax=Flavisolibacter tropicus TaxID=1492898 RepID=A0A172TWJ9_9BACT|nr:hypothetical protein [Flavisolibacter tropicus]ANE51465.1 hypothetical protein SY85_14080 [Flavisolibacter tropicus]
MTLRDFNQLSDLSKEEVLDLKGTVVTDRLEKRTQVVIYQVDNFYVEVHYDLLTETVRRYKGCVRTDLRN